MKQLIVILSITLISSSLFAQDNTKFNEGMKAALSGLSKAKTPEEYQAIANKLERIGSVETNQWEPIYYLALVKSIQAFDAKDKAAAASELEALSPKLENAINLSSMVGNSSAQSEIHTLMAMMYTARMMENPMALGAKFSPLRDNELKKAEALDRNNPRIWLLRAQNLFYTPEAFGGDKKKAKEYAQKALGLFDAQEAEGSKGLMPRWGKDQAQALIKSMTKKK